MPADAVWSFLAVLTVSNYYLNWVLDRFCINDELRFCILLIQPPAFCLRPTILTLFFAALAAALAWILFITATYSVV